MPPSSKAASVPVWNPQDGDCASCADPAVPGSEDAAPRNECPKSERPCGHHCNHSWTHDACDWCGQEWGEE